MGSARIALGDLLHEQAGHQPLATRGRHRIDERERQLQRHAVGHVARNETIRERQRVAGELEFARVVARACPGRFAEHVVERPVQRRLFGRRSAPVPGVERGRRADVGRQLACEERCELLVVAQQSAASPFRFDLARLCEHARIRAQERRARIDLAAREALAQEQRMRLVWLLAPELHETLLREHQAEQRGLFVRDDRATLARPVRVAPAPLHEVRRLLLDPCRLDARARERVDLAQVKDLPREQPRGRRLRDIRSRKDPEPAFARPAVLPLFVLARDLRRPAGEKAAVDGFVRAGIGEWGMGNGRSDNLFRVAARCIAIRARLDVFHHSRFPIAHSAQLLREQELPMHLPPFAHAQEREEVLLAPVAQFRLREFGVGLDVRVPEAQHADEIRTRVGEARVRGVGLRTRVGGTLARILHAEEGREHEQFAQRAEPARLDQHPSERDVDRELREVPPDRREALVAVDRAEFGEPSVAVRDRALGGRLDEREFGRVAELER